MNTHEVWYVVWSEARAEKRVANRLAASGFDVWLPLVVERRRWSDRWKNVAVPLFPGYLFASTRGAGFVPLLRVPGVRTLVKEGERPATLAGEFVARLRAIVARPETGAERFEPTVTFSAGDPVVVQEGPLAGIKGRVVQLRGARRLLVWLDSVGRGLRCTLGSAAVLPA